MIYFIFLKYLRSLEEFGKILMSKFLLNLLVEISKALVYSKIQFLFEKEFYSTFGPISPVARRPIRSFWPRAARQAEPTHQAMPPFPFLPHRAGSATTSSRTAAAPWTPPLLLPHPGAATVTPPSLPTSLFNRPQLAPPPSLW
jgi:hypothetical protein